MSNEPREQAALLLLTLYGYGRTVQERTSDMLRRDLVTVEDFFAVQRQVGAKAQRETPRG